MRASTSFVATAAMLVAGASAEKYLGFNSGATLADRSAKFKKDFEAEFRTAQNLEKAPGKFNAVRLYTNVQAYSKDDPIQAFEAAIDTNTKMLLGIWTSGTESIANELNALKKAVDKHGKKFTDLVVGMSVGSEDLYRVSETGIKNKSGVGNGPKEIVKFIDDYKKAFANTPLASVPVGHVDTWDVWINGSNKAVIDAVDWIGVDEYPYYENGKGNNIENSGVLFDKAFDAVVAASAGKEVWLTETGWPYIGPAWDKAVASKENAKYYWNEVGCRKLFGKVHTFWYNLRDSNPDNEMKFAITENLSTKPLFDLSCPTTFKTPTTTDDDATPSGTGVATPTSSGSGSGGSGSPSGPGGTPASNDQGASGPEGASKGPGSGAASVAVSGLAIAVGVFAALL